MDTISFFGVSTGWRSVGGFDVEADTRGACVVGDACTFDGVDEIGLHDERNLVALDADVLVAGLVFKGKPPPLDSTAWSTRDADADGGFRFGLRVERFL